MLLLHKPKAGGSLLREDRRM
ncbi:hypothetical protein HU200_062141 [Digitaria exilis]|uniref:Uncharacterized protein n=1 Tax=Digitaria exilis TaxID=1010633 RepID=A0A835E0C3_9POAL|nr:hypothetical protein HU200_062141 [Digitaria exilis]